ncbi:MAG: protein kinase [Phycisphaerales bacterium]|nr:protein kinase [Phycisphaerales bacterium]
MEGCPSQATLDVFVESGEPDGDVQRHCADCAECRTLVAELRANAQFLTEFRAAVTIGSPLLVDSPGEPPKSSESDAVASPDLVSGYRILEEIHRGGQGVVYRALQVQTQRTVAIKMLLAGRGASARDRERFERETRIAAGLSHPNIVTVYDSITVPGGGLAFAMEYIEGEPLDRWSAGLTRGRDDRRRVLRDRLRVMAKVCDAVLYAHQHAIVHRDLKPANILVDSAGEPHVLDFGIAQDLGPEERTRLTYTGAFAGTLAYASPEQVSGDPSRVDTRTDIYSLGVIMYEMVAGRMPYAVDGPMGAAIRNIERADPAPLSRRTRDGHGPFADDEVSTIILKAMAKDPARRYQTAAGLGNDIKRYLAGEAIEARRDSTWYVLRKTARRYRLAMSAALMIVTLVAVSAIMMSIQASRLAVALSNGNVERGRGLVKLGNIPEAQALLWTELLNPIAGIQRWNPAQEQLPRSRAWWALWELHAAQPCEATVSASGLTGSSATVTLLLPAPGRDDIVLIADTETMGLWTFPDLTLKAKTAFPPRNDRAWWLRGVAFTSHGEIVIGDKDNTLRRWDATTLEALAKPLVLPPPAYPVFSADGTRFAVWHEGRALPLDPAAEALPVLDPVERQPSKPPRGMILSPDGEWLAGVEQGGITVLRVGTPDPPTRYPFEPAEQAVNLAFTKGIDGGAPLLFFTEYTRIWMLDAQRDKGIRPFAVIEGGSLVDRTALSADGRWLAVAGQDRRLSIWDTTTPGAPALRYFMAHDAAVSSLAFANTGRTLLSGHRDGVVQRWDLSDLLPRPASEKLRAHAEPNSPPRRGAFSPLAGHSKTVMAVAVDESGLRGYSMGSEGLVLAWDLARGRKAARSADLGGQVESISLSPDGRTVAVAIDLGDQADVILLDSTTLKERSRIASAHAIRAADLSFAPDGAVVATAGDDALVRLWDVPSAAKTAEVLIPSPPGPGPAVSQIRTVRFSPDGRSLAWGGLYGVAGVTDATLRGLPRDLPGHIATVRCVRFSPDGRRVAGAGNDSTIRIWDANTGRTLNTIKGHVGVVYGLDFSPDGRLLASGGADGTVRLWDAETGDNLAIFRDQFTSNGEGLMVFVVQFTPDGDHLFVGGNGGYLGLWDLRHYDRHIAGSLEYQLDGLKESGRPSPMAAAVRRWAERHKHAGENKQ